MRKKVERYILRQEGVSIHKENDSGSTYYKVGSQKIRVSDHQNFAFTAPNTLEVLLPSNTSNIILVIGGRFAIVDYVRFKEFIRTFTFIALYTKPINMPKPEKPVITRLDPSVITGLDPSGLTEKQIAGLKNLISIYRTQNSGRK